MDNSELLKELILDIKNLSVDFSTENGTYNAVKGLNLSVGNGEILGLVGESGSGKSVTSLALMRLLKSPPAIITNGEINFKNKNKEWVNLLSLDNNTMRDYRGNEIAMIFQEPMTSLNPVMKCGKQVIEAITAHKKTDKKKSKEICLELFKEVLLPEPEKVFDKYPHELSGGQKQRIMIAMALSGNPSLLIADEPTTALDVTVQKSIIELIRNLNKKYGMSVIFITHDLGVVAEISDKIAVMYQGNIVEQGLKNDILLHPKHPYTCGLISCRPPLSKRPEKLITVSDFLNNKSVVYKTISPEERKQNHDILYSQNPLLEVKDLEVKFNLKKNFFGKSIEDFVAVKKVSFDVFRGETLGIVGESGCGKTTIGRSILNLIDISSGQIIYEGKNLKLLGKSEMREVREKVQIIFQDPYSSLNPRITIGNSIIEPMRVHKIEKNDKTRKEKAISLLEKVSLSSAFFNRYPHELSGGQRQRVCIARALALNPQLIVCDESVSSLDVSVQAQVLNLLNHLKKELGLTYIFISHDLSVVKYMSDRVLVIKSGQIVEKGEADNLYNNPQHPYTQKLISSIPDLPTI
jgi:peptide/nickel transport system ATP-binding protein